MVSSILSLIEIFIRQYNDIVLLVYGAFALTGSVLILRRLMHI